MTRLERTTRARRPWACGAALLLLALASSACGGSNKRFGASTKAPDAGADESSDGGGDGGSGGSGDTGGSGGSGDTGGSGDSGGSDGSASEDCDHAERNASGAVIGVFDDPCSTFDNAVFAE